jgi:hypothetical protein
VTVKKIASRDASSSPAAAVQDGLEGTWRKELLKALLQGARNFENSLASLEPQRDVASIVNGMLKFSDDEAVQKERGGRRISKDTEPRRRGVGADAAGVPSTGICGRP